jgi:hypothetical protein
MKKIFLIYILITISFNSNSQNYNFSNTLDRDKLELYLARSITMQSIEDDLQSGNTITYNSDIRFLRAINARFIGRSTGLWTDENQINNNYFTRVQKLVTDITNEYNTNSIVKPIIQAGMFEIVTTNVNNIAIPAHVASTYGISVRNFKFDLMLYNDFPSNTNHQTTWGSNTTAVPDISKRETQMWFYFLATRYIDCGIEALHFGQVEIMDDNDANHVNYWDVLSKIRVYAKTRNRGVVVCDAHTNGLYLNNTNQLLFDIHSAPTRPKNILPNFGTGSGGSCIIEKGHMNGIYNQSKGGKTYFGWECVSLPYLVELDNYNGPWSPNSISSWTPWGWDEITWFGIQSNTFRKDWLNYAYHKVKCLDINGFFQMPGVRGMSGATTFSSVYRASNGSTPTFFGDETQIKNIWDGNLNSNKWVRHNFTDEWVINQPKIPHVKSDIVFVGDNRIYYIANDNRVHGYIKYNGTWMTVSPSWAAHSTGQNISTQVQAKSSLIASPDGQYLYYIGTDELVYRYKINNDWSYTYSAMPTNSAMLSQNIRANNSLVCLGNDRIYYVARELGSSNAKRVHAFVLNSGSWTTTSPSWVANSNGTSISNQQQVNSNIVVSPNGQKIYFIGANGLFYCYNIHNVWLYTYSTLTSSNTMMINQNIRGTNELVCNDDSRIYYIANEIGNSNSKRIHALIFYNGSWTTTSPSWVANSNGTPIGNQSQFKSDLRISQNKGVISYIGLDNQLHGFNVANVWLYSYFNFHPTSTNFQPTNSCVFKNNSELFYVAGNEKKVHRYVFESNNCGNSIITQIEPNFTYKISQNNSIDSKEKFDFDPTLFPNPSDGNFKIDFGQNLDKVKISIYTITGQLILNREVLDCNSFEFREANFQNGIYLLKVSSGEIDKTIRIVIEK